MSTQHHKMRRAVRFLILTLACLSVLYEGRAAAQGYSIRADRVVVDTKEHWLSWQYPKDVIRISEDGRVTPRFFRKYINAVKDALVFGGGIAAAGSNVRDAARAMDGDPGTFWEPDSRNPVEDWWILVDLGRLVSAAKIVLRFVAEGQGDPFLQFKVLTSSGKRAFRGSDAMEFVSAGGTTKSNRTQRVFEFPLSPVDKADESWTGRVVQYVRVMATRSALDRAEQISEEAYRSLPPEHRGTVEYIWRIAGEERTVSWADYEALPTSERGAIRYYRRELPRLAEVEVWSVGENIALGIAARGGSIDVVGTSAPANAFDGNYNSKWDVQIYKATGPTPEWGLSTVDLGALFWVDTFRIITGKGQSTQLPYLYGYETKVSDGSKAPDGSLRWEVVSPKSRELNYLIGSYRFEDRFEPRKVRYLQFKHLDVAERTRAHLGDRVQSTVTEFQIFGEGYVPEVVLESGPIGLGSSRNLTTIEWSAEEPPNTRVEVRTRTGDELREVKHFFDINGTEITERQYNALIGAYKGPIVVEHVPGSGWSGWSRPYLEPGDPITSPSPRKYLALQVKLLSNDPRAGASIRSLAVRFQAPVARELVGEISPDVEVSIGRPQEFKFFLRPTFVPTNPGFDEILLRSPSGARMELLSLDLGREEAFLNRETEVFLPRGGGGFLNEKGEELRVFLTDSDSMWVRLPRKVRAGRADLLICLRFRSPIFLSGTAFEGSVANSSVPGSWQQVDPGDATPLGSGEGMTVFGRTGAGILSDVEVSPNPFTPNGDGTNEQVFLRFSVLKINTDRPVTVELYSMDGRLVKRLSERRATAAGRYEMTWRGDDMSGRTVPPGLYLARIVVDADWPEAEDRALVRTVYVGY